MKRLIGAFLTIFLSFEVLAKIEVAGDGVVGKKANSYVKDKSVWSGVMLDNGEFKIHKTVATVFDTSLAEEKAGVKITFSPEVAFAIHGMNFKEGQIIPAMYLTSPMAIDPGERPQYVSFGKIKAKIYGTISIGNEEYEKHGDLNGKTNYKMVIETKEASVVIDPPMNSHTVHYLFWIGDLNGDGFPDILTHPGKDLMYPQVLLLSKRVGNKVRMEEIGEIGARADVHGEIPQKIK